MRDGDIAHVIFSQRDASRFSGRRPASTRTANARSQASLLFARHRSPPSRHACLRSYRQPHQLPRVSRYARAEAHRGRDPRSGEARAFRRQPAAVARRRADRRAARRISRHHSREAARAAGRRRHRVPRVSTEPARAVSLTAFQVRRRPVRDARHPARRQTRAPAALRAQLRAVRRAGRAVLLDRSPHGRGPVGRRRHVHAEHHAAGARARPAHVPAGSLGDLVPDDREFLQLPADYMFFCGMALGYMDESEPVNKLRTERAQLAEFATLQRFRRFRTGTPAPTHTSADPARTRW